MQPQNYQTGSDSFQDNMADPNALQASRVKQGRRTKKMLERSRAERDLIHETTEYNNLCKNDFANVCSWMQLIWMNEWIIYIAL